MNEPSTQDEQIQQVQALLNYEGEVAHVNEKTLLTTLNHVKGRQIKVDINRLKLRDNFNPRIRDADHIAHIRALADSIKSNGFYEDKPLAVVSGNAGTASKPKLYLYITDGSCRFEALQLAISEGAKIDFVPVVIKDRATTEEDLTVALVMSNSGKRFKPLELAVVVKRLNGWGWSEKRISEELPFTQEYVTQLLTIAGAPRLIRQMIIDGEVPFNVALQTMREHGQQASDVLQGVVAKAKEGGAKGITRKHLPSQVYKKALVKAAPQMADTMAKLQADPAFGQLTPDLQTAVTQLVQGIQKAKTALDQAQPDNGDGTDQASEGEQDASDS